MHGPRAYCCDHVVGPALLAGQRQHHLLGLNFQRPTSETEAALIQLIDGENAWFQKVKRVGSIEALFLLLGSVVLAEPILRRS